MLTAIPHRGESIVRTIDRIFGWLMVVSALLHCIGTLSAHLSAGETLWSLGAGLAEALLAALNLLRAGRAADRTLAAVSLAGCVGWLALTVGFANLIHNFADFRVLIQAGVTLVLLFFSARAVFASAEGRSTAA